MAITTVAATKTASTRTVDKYGKAARLLVGGAGLLLVFAACSNDESPAVGSLAPITPNTGVTGASQPAVVATSTVATAVSPVPGPTPAPAPLDGAALLQQGLAAMNGGYHFNQTATVDGVPVLTVDGDRLVDGTRLTLTGEGGLVWYIITPDGSSYALAEGGEWEALDATPDAVDPILALFAPTSVSVASIDGTTVQLAVTVPLTSLGIEGEGDAPVQVTFVSGALTNIAYSATTPEGRIAAATTVIGPVVDASPVVAPI